MSEEIFDTIDFRILANSGLRSLVPYQAGKDINELTRELGIVSTIKLASNENPLGASPRALNAIHRTLEKVHLYPDSNYFILKNALANFYALLPEQITLGNGSENVIELIIKTYLHQGDHAVTSQYTFMMIQKLLQSYSVNTSIVPTKHWQHDIHGLLAAITPKTRVVFLVNPNNPLGTYANKQDFEFLVKHLPKNILLVVDEAYTEYIQTDDYPNALDYLAQYPNLVVIRTFSKAYGLAALRIGYALSSSEIADMLNRARLPFNLNTIGAAAAVGALSDQSHVSKSVQLNASGMLQLTEGFRKLAIEFIPSVGNFITFKESVPHTYQQLLQRGIIIRPLSAYQLPQYLRVSIGTSAQNTHFLEALNEIT